jgi:hypothetical protein
MSSQGGDSYTEADSRRLLEAWGMWARSGDLGIGYSRIKLFGKSPTGTGFSDNDLVLVDRVVAGLPQRHKRIAKQVFLHADHRQITENDIAACVGEFHAVFVLTAWGQVR